MHLYSGIFVHPAFSGTVVTDKATVQPLATAGQARTNGF